MLSLAVSWLAMLAHVQFILQSPKPKLLPYIKAAHLFQKRDGIWIEWVEDSIGFSSGLLGIHPTCQATHLHACQAIFATESHVGRHAYQLFQ